MYAVYYNVLKSDKGKELICLYASTSDAQAMFSNLVQHHTTSTLGKDRLTDLLKYITTTRLGDGTWNGTTHAFVLHYQHQMRLYNEYTKEPLSEQLMLIHLQNAVEPVETLSCIRITAEQFEVTTGTPLTYTSYCQLLTTACQTYDKSKGASTGGKIKRCQVYKHDVIEEQYQDITYDFDTPLDVLPPHSDDYGEFHDVFDLNEMDTYRTYQSIQVPNERWKDLSQEAVDEDASEG